MEKYKQLLPQKIAALPITSHTITANLENHYNEERNKTNPFVLILDKSSNNLTL